MKMDLPFFSFTMSYKSFYIVAFDLTTYIVEMKEKTDKLAAVREILDLFENKFKIVYTPAEYTTMDEQLISLRARCSFRQYLPNKPKNIV